MAGFTPAASGGGSIGAAGGGAPIKLGKEPVNVRAGVGTFVRADADARELIVDGLTGAPAESVSFARAGALAPVGLLAKYAGTRWGGTSYVTLAEATVSAAPVATPADCHVLRIAGSAGGSMDVPLTDQYQATNAATPTLQAGWDHPGAWTNYSVTINGSNAARGRAWQFIPTADVLVQSLGFGFINTTIAQDGNAAGTDGATKELAILDADMRELASLRFSNAIGGLPQRWPLAYALKLLQGTTYWFAVRYVEGAQGDGDGFRFSGRVKSDAAPIGATFTGKHRVICSNAPTGTDWQTYDWDALTFNNTVYPGTTNYGPDAHILQYEVGYDSPMAHDMGCFAAGVGVAISGDILVSLVTLGAGPTDPGADMNGRLLIASEGV